MESDPFAAATSPFVDDDGGAYPSNASDGGFELEYSPSSVLDGTFDPDRLDEYSPCADVRETYVGSSGVPLYAPAPVSYYRSILSLSEDDMSTYVEGLPQLGSPCDTTLPDDFKLTAAEELELLDAYSVRDTRDPSAGYPSTTEEAGSHDRLDGPLAPASPIRDNESYPTGEEGEDQVGEDRYVGRVLQRKAYFRAIADNVGYNITDPDTITTHEKKRSYVECLEDYVEWLHEQIRLTGHEPLPMECVAGYRGLKSRSLRTILVYKQRQLYSLNLEKIQAQDRFMQLQAAIVAQECAVSPSGLEVYRMTTGDMPQQHIHPFHS